MRGISSSILIILAWPIAALAQDDGQMEGGDEDRQPRKTFSTDSPEVQAAVRQKWDKSPDLPDGLAFIEQAALVTAEVQKIDAGDRTNAEFYFERTLDVSASEAETIVTLMLNAFSDFETDTFDSAYSLSCSNGVPRAYNEDAYEILESIDDTRVDIASRSYRDAKAKLSDEAAGKFQEWLQETKANTVYTKVDYRKFDELTGRNQSTTLSAICATGGVKP